jgi:aminoglycoside phosphotransferase (APT) family kinase protein
VPRFEVIGRPAFGYPHPFVGYRRLPGRPAMDVGETLLDVRSGGERLGVFLAALHGFPPHEARRLGVEEDAPDQAYDDETSDGASSLLAAVAPVLPAEVVARARGLLAATPPPARELALVHTDFFPEHLLVDAGAPSGVIDWGDVALGDPAVDLAGLAYCGGAPLLAAGLDVYCRLRALGPEEAAALALRARRGAVFRALDDLSYGRGAGRPAYVEMALRALGRV